MFVPTNTCSLAITDTYQKSHNNNNIKLLGLSLHASIWYHDWVRWSMTRVKWLWKPLSDELSAGHPPYRSQQIGGDLATHQSQCGGRCLRQANAEGLGPYHHGGVASLPPHPAPPQRANHANWVNGGNTHTTYRIHEHQIHTHTQWKLHASGGRVGQQRGPQILCVARSCSNWWSCCPCLQQL